jgi:hypothetical protein
MHTTSNDNRYPTGMTVAAKVDPGLPLIIDAYYQRIYYCSVIGQPDHKVLAYFERELVPSSLNLQAAKRSTS